MRDNTKQNQSLWISAIIDNLLVVLTFLILFANIIDDDSHSGNDVSTVDEGQFN